MTATHYFLIYVHLFATALELYCEMIVFCVFYCIYPFKNSRHYFVRKDFHAQRFIIPFPHNIISLPICAMHEIL